MRMGALVLNPVPASGFITYVSKGLSFPAWACCSSYLARPVACSISSGPVYSLAFVALAEKALEAPEIACVFFRRFPPRTQILAIVDAILTELNCLCNKIKSDQTGLLNDF